MIILKAVTRYVWQQEGMAMQCCLVMLMAPCMSSTLMMARHLLVPPSLRSIHVSQLPCLGALKPHLSLVMTARYTAEPAKPQVQCFNLMAYLHSPICCWVLQYYTSRQAVTCVQVSFVSLLNTAVSWIVTARNCFTSECLLRKLAA